MFPSTLWKKVSSANSRFWWGENQRVVKSVGRMEGYDRITKVWWYGFPRAESFQYCPVAEAISEAYYRTWLSLGTGFEGIKAGSFWKVGNGLSLSIWNDCSVNIPGTSGMFMNYYLTIRENGIRFYFLPHGCLLLYYGYSYLMDWGNWQVSVERFSPVAFIMFIRLSLCPESTFWTIMPTSLVRLLTRRSWDGRSCGVSSVHQKIIHIMWRILNKCAC